MTYTNSKKIRRVVLFVFLAASLILICFLSIYVGPEEIVNRIGIRNGYIVAIVVSFFAGFSAFTAIPFYSMLVTFLSGGMNPVLLGLIAGTSLALGDIFLFYFGRKGRDMISGRFDRAINRIADYFHKRQREKYIPVLSYVYISFIPLPNDWLLLFLASIRYPQKNMNLIIILGDYTHTCIIIFLTVKGIMIFT